MTKYLNECGHGLGCVYWEWDQPKSFCWRCEIERLREERDDLKSQLKSSWPHAEHVSVTDHYEEEIAELREELGHRQAEIERLTNWVHDLQSGMYINCVYCGHRYGPKDDVPATMQDALYEHIAACPKHPLSKAEAEIERLKEDNHEMVGLFETAVYAQDEHCQVTTAWWRRVRAIVEERGDG